MRKLAIFGFCALGLSLVSCFEENAAPTVLAENTAVMCNDGIDNDGDGNFDCYDHDCWIQDSLSRASNTHKVLCAYENYASPIATRLSSSATNASSSALSSSSQEGTLSGFPVTLVDAATEVRALALTLGSSGSVIVAGQAGPNGFFTTIDPTGFVGIRKLLTVSLASPSSFESVIGFHFRGIGFDAENVPLFYGASLTTLDTSSHYFTKSGDQQYRFLNGDSLGFYSNISATSICGLVNDGANAKGFVFAPLSVNASSASSVTLTVSITNGKIVAGEIVGTDCAGIGNRNPGTGSEIVYFRLDQNNASAISTGSTFKISTGASDEIAYDLETVGSQAYIAATVDGAPKMLVVETATGLRATAVGDLDVTGVPSRIRAVTVGGVDKRLLVVGTQAGQGVLWLVGTDGVVITKITEPLVDAFTDALQLDGTTLYVSGYKGKAGKVMRYNTSLQAF